MAVFQLESPGMRELLKRMAPDRFEDLIALLALYRPGPLGSGMVDAYVRRKHGEEKVIPLHPDLAGILEETSGRQRDRVYVYRRYLGLLGEGTELT